MNNITLEFCAEDRARIDRLIAAMERKACDKCVADALAAMSGTAAPADHVHAALAATLEKAKAAGATEAQTLTTTPESKEQPATTADACEAKPQEPPTPTVTLEDIRKQVIKLTTAGKKAEIRTVVSEYSANIKVGEIPADKYAEVLDKLKALEA
jgi:uncharacterized protein YkwD